ncbi:hypothetical protein FBZ87_104181 [Nitrospirillum amazonense]|uniref:Lipoprotein n=1 Tax=Nitrospirillum amazonense TaxID=28077 RepID=A0A560JVD7_9PROT|nr:hypothetical protein [Nitrospirillum amazonense]TWB75083.1 hypothetical protein FBZ87_104181 [Nitrospirillum amazonense]
MTSRKILTAAAVAALLSVCGCVSSTKVESNRAADYTPNIKKLFILPNLGKTLITVDGNETGHVLALLKAGFEGCGITATGYAVQALATPKAIDDAAPDAVLDIAWTKQTQQGYDNTVDYLVSLYDRHGKAIVWKATIELNQHLKAAEELSYAITSRMQKDGLVGAACVTPKPNL